MKDLLAPQIGTAALKPQPAFFSCSIFVFTWLQAIARLLAIATQLGIDLARGLSRSLVGSIGDSSHCAGGSKSLPCYVVLRYSSPRVSFKAPSFSL